MYYKEEIIRYLQSNNILALKLDHALAGVGDFVSNQIDSIGAGAKRALYYSSCFTEEYQEVCKQQKNEDVRFIKGLNHLFQNRDVIHEILMIYFDEVLRNKEKEQLEHIKNILMAANIHIAVNSLTKSGFVLATATCVSIGMNLNLDMGAIAGRTVGVAVTVSGLYGIVQKAADSAERLRICYPAFYSTLYANELEMLYFLVEPLFVRAHALNAERTSDTDIANIIKRMIG